MARPAPLTEIEREVIVLGGGLAGLAAATRLARAGVDVLCVEPRPFEFARVGESLDWSAPQLLADLGFGAEELLETKVATRKLGIRLQPDDGPAVELAPEPWFARAPLSLEIETLHLDRERFDRALLAAAEGAGVDFRHERVSAVRVADDRVECVETPSARLRARRYVDASGAARLVGRAFALGARTYGPPKVSLWTHLAAPREAEGTTLHVLGCGAYLRWIWEIPIAPDRLSVGLTLTADELRRGTAVHGGAEGLLRAEIGSRERLNAALQSTSELRVHARSFQCSVLDRASGPNWVAIGESAAMIDPLTSNGFTFALRFAEHASDLIASSLQRPALPAAGRRVFDACSRRTAHAFNDHIERIAYEPKLRAALGLRRATLVYVLFGYFCNAVCQRLRPRGWVGGQALRAVLAGFRLWRAGWTLAAQRRAPAA
jgi:flavin-dependent dehydrogenase